MSGTSSVAGRLDLTTAMRSDIMEEQGRGQLNRREAYMSIDNTVAAIQAWQSGEINWNEAMRRADISFSQERAIRGNISRYSSYWTVYNTVVKASSIHHSTV